MMLSCTFAPDPPPESLGMLSEAATSCHAVDPAGVKQIWPQRCGSQGCHVPSIGLLLRIACSMDKQEACGSIAVHSWQILGCSKTLCTGLCLVNVASRCSRLAQPGRGDLCPCSPRQSGCCNVPHTICLR